MLRNALVPPSSEPSLKTWSLSLSTIVTSCLYTSLSNWLEDSWRQVLPQNAYLTDFFLNKWNIKSGMHACLVAQLCPTFRNFMDSRPPGSSVRGILLARILKWVAMPSSRDLLNPGIEPASPALQADSLLLSHWGSPDGLCGSESRSVVSNSLRPHGLYSPWNSPGQNTGLGSCSLLQGIFPTQR